jgi:hypothetical protein
MTLVHIFEDVEYLYNLIEIQHQSQLPAIIDLSWTRTVEKNEVEEDFRRAVPTETAEDIHQT